ncbi:MAG: CRISPR-associated protein Cas5 [Candidatus Micrarchaeota archaeon]|nr:MAG: CRISPR-associated protein Cas5 [Candidatus Micrarchaeota archaeon]
MNLEDYFIFDIKLDSYLAMFKDKRTATTRVSHLIPNKSQIIGMLLAKLGFIKSYTLGDLFDKNQIHTYKNFNGNNLFNIKYAIKVNMSGSSTIKRFLDYVNFVGVGKYSKLIVSPVYIDYIVSPSYEIVIFIPRNLDILSKEKDHLLDKNYEMCKIYFGTNECPAHIEEINEISYDAINKETGQISTEFVLPRSSIKEVLSDNSNFIIEEIEDSEGKNQMKEVIVPIGSKVKVNLNEDIECFKYKDYSFVVL